MFVHKSIAHLCSQVVSGTAACGVGNTMGNKGGIGIGFSIAGTRIHIVNAHLAAHDNAIAQRNADFKKISTLLPKIFIKKLALLKENRNRTNSGTFVQESGSSRSNRDMAALSDGPEASQLAMSADRVIFMGDLNYRIRGNKYDYVLFRLFLQNLDENLLIFWLFYFFSD